MDLTCCIWSTFDYYFANYAILVLPAQTSGDKIVYVRSNQTEIGGETCRHCGQCVCITQKPRAITFFAVMHLKSVRVLFAVKKPSCL